MKHVSLAVLAVALLLTKGARAQRVAATGSDLPAVDAAAMLRTVKPDLQQRLAQFKPVKMPFDASALSAVERQMIDQLVIASRDLESIQSSNPY
jgi:hypothetical protein